jgi:hypothetical protein
MEQILAGLKTAILRNLSQQYADQLKFREHELFGLSFWVENQSYLQGFSGNEIHQTLRVELTKQIDRLRGKLKLSATNDTSYFIVQSTNFQPKLIPDALTSLIESKLDLAQEQLERNGCHKDS